MCWKIKLEYNDLMIGNKINGRHQIFVSPNTEVTVFKKKAHTTEEEIFTRISS